MLRDNRNMELGWEKERGTKFGFTHTGDRHPVLRKLRTDEPVPVCSKRRELLGCVSEAENGAEAGQDGYTASAAAVAGAV